MRVCLVVAYSWYFANSRVLCPHCPWQYCLNGMQIASTALPSQWRSAKVNSCSINNNHSPRTLEKNTMGLMFIATTTFAIVFSASYVHGHLLPKKRSACSWRQIEGREFWAPQESQEGQQAFRWVVYDTKKYRSKMKMERASKKGTWQSNRQLIPINGNKQRLMSTGSFSVLLPSEFHDICKFLYSRTMGVI